MKNSTEFRILLGLITVAVLIVSVHLLSEPLPPVSAAIAMLCADTPRHPMLRHPEQRRELADMIHAESRAHDLPALLVTAIVYRESSFLPDAMGSLGEIGLMQAMPRWYRRYKADRKTPHGQIRAGCALLRYCIDKCRGDIEGGLGLYVSGKGCKVQKGSSIYYAVRRRVRLWKRLEEDANATH